MIDLSEVHFNEQGLIPAIAQEANSCEVLMMAWMNEESLKKTIETGRVWYYSRSRQELWEKGATSGNIQELVSIKLDCDGDALLVKVKQTGPACHTGARTCFSTELAAASEISTCEKFDICDLYNTICNRKVNPPEGSYTAYLINKGLDKICKKVGEEATEVVIAAKNEDKEELTYELADLLYHSLVLMAMLEVTPDDVRQELYARVK